MNHVLTDDNSQYCIINIEELDKLRQNTIDTKNKLDLTENLLKNNDYI